MDNIAKNTIAVPIEGEMKKSYLDYAMSVIVGRALPDARDGLKPVHRRILYAMFLNNNLHNRPYVKCARIVGEVMGKFHPHGDNAIYDALVRMAQEFSMRHPIIDGQGNFGSIDGDNAAAMRYTECRLDKYANEILADLGSDTVNFQANYDGKEKEPVVLPSKIPNLLVNGSSGIAVGMATNIPPHNLSEVIDACSLILKKPESSVQEIMKLLPGPDFPTKGLISGNSGIIDAYNTGRGRVIMKAKTHFEKSKGQKDVIIVDELPYQVNKSNLLIKVADLVRNKKLEGISDIRDESDKSGIRVVFELKKGEVPEIILNRLFKDTQMQDSFGINMVALINNVPKLMNLKELLQIFIAHRREVVTRRTQFNLKKAKLRCNTLEGLAVALSNIDEFIALIKNSQSPSVAKKKMIEKEWHSDLILKLLSKAKDKSSFDAQQDLALKTKGSYKLNLEQASKILEMQLQKLTGLEHQKIVDEYSLLLDEISDLSDILNTPDRVKKIISDELNQTKKDHGQERRTLITEGSTETSEEDFITPEDLVVTMSHTGYIKAQPLTEYRAQKRGGRGKQATSIKQDDFVESLFTANTHDFILCFSNLGQVYWLKVYEVPRAGRGSRGKPIVNLLKLLPHEKVTSILPIKSFDDDRYVFMATLNGTVKKTPLSDFSRPRQTGIKAVQLDAGDYLIGSIITDGMQDILLLSSKGKCVRFNEKDVRSMGRTARGVRGIRMSKGVKCISLSVLKDANSSLLFATEKGFGKRTKVKEFTPHARGTQGVIAIQTSEKTGNVLVSRMVNTEDEIMLITNGGVLIRTRVSEIREMGRATQGVRLINLGEGEKLAGLVKIEEKEED